jgi:DNA end-binding protein Ku
MARALWTGSISFGLVNIPVQVYTATKDKDIHFHQICKRDNSRVRQKLVCEADQKEVSRDELLKGYEVAPDQYVVFEKNEIDKLQPEKNQNIEVQDFVDESQIDPIYFDKPYYLLPKGGAVKSFKILLEAMRQSKRVAIGRFVMRGKEYLGALRPMDSVICLEIMRFPDEVVTTDQIETPPLGKTVVKDAELKMAKQLIDSLSSDFNPEQYQNEYRERVNSAIEAKARGQQVVTGPEVEIEPTKVGDLMSALKNSIAQAKRTHRRKTG